MSYAVLTPPRTKDQVTPARTQQGSERQDDLPEALERRARRLVQSEIGFIPNQSFLAVGAEDQIAREEEQAIDSRPPPNSKVPQGLPSHLARMCESELLPAAAESRLFRRMNFLKFKANAIRNDIDPEHPDAEPVERAERCLEEAKAIRDRIVRANMRLVMSVVKKFVTPQQSFNEMLSEGIYSLMQAVEKFDYDRGFRFSTYAYRSIARNSYRKITDQLKENARFANSDESVAETPDERTSSAACDQAWDRRRGLLNQMIERLDRRERFIIRSRYALGAHRKVRSFQCLGDKLGVSKERVRQLEQRAVAKLRSFAGELQIDEVFGPACG